VIVIGPLTQRFMSGATWSGLDDFPSPQEMADDVENVLTFLTREKFLDAFSAQAKKQPNPRKRDELFAEARAAYYLAMNGFKVFDWHASGASGKEGEFKISLGSSPDIFVEVKAPGYQGEISSMIDANPKHTHQNFQSLKDRRKQPKFISGVKEGFAIAPHLDCMSVVRKKVLPKLMNTCPNLAVVIDNCFITPVGNFSLVEDVQKEYMNPARDPNDPEDKYDYNLLGGVLFLNLNSGPDGSERGVDYNVSFAQNPNALPACSLPAEVIAHFLKLGEESEKRTSQMWSDGRTNV
jgi:hypothetical protein